MRHWTYLMLIPFFLFGLVVLYVNIGPDKSIVRVDNADGSFISQDRLLDEKNNESFTSQYAIQSLSNKKQGKVFFFTNLRNKIKEIYKRRKNATYPIFNEDSPLRKPYVNINSINEEPGPKVSDIYQEKETGDNEGFSKNMSDAIKKEKSKTISRNIKQYERGKK